MKLDRGDRLDLLDPEESLDSLVLVEGQEPQDQQDPLVLLANLESLEKQENGVLQENKVFGLNLFGRIRFLLQNQCKMKSTNINGMK